MELVQHVYSVLAISTREKFYTSLRGLLPEDRYSSLCWESDVTSARRLLLERTFDIVVISTPLPDEFGTKLAMHVVDSSSAGVLLLVGAEHAAGHLDDTFTMTVDITDYCYVNKCSVVGLMVGETVPVRELLYGTILPSGADAALGLAVYVSGSQEAFVELMNQKLEELGVSGTAHFTNCVGLYDENHYCTVTDMALILRAAMENDLCREVLNARKYETAPTEYHPDGQVLSNWFLRRIEDRFPGDFQIIGAKTGYVVQAGSCAVSCGQGADGKRYFCATGDASSAWRAIYDHTNLYQTYCS